MDVKAEGCRAQILHGSACLRHGTSMLQVLASCYSHVKSGRQSTQDPGDADVGHDAHAPKRRLILGHDNAQAARIEHRLTRVSREDSVMTAASWSRTPSTTKLISP